MKIGRQMRPVALVTGASSGIGAATARALAKSGHDLVLAARTSAALETLATELAESGLEVIARPTDLTNRRQVQALADEAWKRFAQVDVLVNNAGVGADHPAWGPTDEQIDAILETNLVAPIELIRALVPGMVERRRGHVFNIGSVSGHIASPMTGLYCASKFALRGYNDSLRRELRPYGVRVTLVSPGFIRTPMTIPFQRLGVPMPGPEAVAQAVVRSLGHARREIVVPGWYRPFVWLEIANPGLVDWLFGRIPMDWAASRTAPDSPQVKRRGQV